MQKKLFTKLIKNYLYPILSNFFTIYISLFRQIPIQRDNLRLLSFYR